MRFMRCHCCLLLVSFAWSTALAQPGRPPKSKPAAPPPVLVFQRTPCEGTCPAYTARVFADGRVAYEGLYAVPVLGRRTLRLPAATVAQLLAEARRLPLAQLRERYRSPATDMPAAVLTVQLPGSAARTVWAEAGVPLPPALAAYLAHLGQCLDPLAGLPAPAR